MRERFSDEEILNLAAKLEDYHRIFYTFVDSIADVYYSDAISTAAIHFYKDSKPALLINRDFWERHNEREKLFIICHECLHVLLDHGLRNGLSVPGATPILVNKAQDITINEMIVDLFDYDRNDFRDWKKYCWIDTCFEDPSKVLRNETFIYYLKLLISQPNKDESSDGNSPITLDSHEGLDDDGSFEKQAAKDAKQKVAESLAEDLTADELESVIKALPDTTLKAGTISSNLEAMLEKKKQRQKLKFARLVKKLKRSSMKEIDFDVESFVKDDRRFRDVASQPDTALPGKVEKTRLQKDRLLTAIFMDISGSCMEYFKTFNDVANAFEAEKNTFDIRLFAFDTAVFEIKLGERIRVGGGTSFSIIEKKCLDLEKETGRYPDCVVIVTDGEGDKVTPTRPSRWIWLLTLFASKAFIPTGSRHWAIKDVIF